jgi:hypothetical protein
MALTERQAQDPAGIVTALAVGSVKAYVKGDGVQEFLNLLSRFASSIAISAVMQETRGKPSNIP